MELNSGHPFGSEPESECFGEGAVHQALRARNQTFHWGKRQQWFGKLLIPQPDRVIDSSRLLKTPNRQRSILEGLNKVKVDTGHFINSV